MLPAAGKQGPPKAGFADQSHLTRWFTRYYGITPGGYRQAASRAA